MKRIAIVGGGIAGLTAAYELQRLKLAGAPIDFLLFEGSNRLGGIVETERRDGFIVECGPDSWVTEKPWARELAIELGLGSQLIHSRDEHRTTYLAENGALRPMPHGMRMMVPTDLSAILASPLFSEQAKAAYLHEPQMADALRAAALETCEPQRDESVREFTIRHFGAEVATTIAAPLLAGVFGGDIARLSARAVLPALMAVEREYGSLILGLQQRSRNTNPVPVFTSLKDGLGSLIERIEAAIPSKNLLRGTEVTEVRPLREGWSIAVRSGSHKATESFEAVILAVPAEPAARLLGPVDSRIPGLLPRESSSAIVVALAFSAEQPKLLRLPTGFGFLVPQRASGERPAREGLEAAGKRALLACTFVNQKFPDRVPLGSALLRVFFGGPSASALLHLDEVTLERLAISALEEILGPLPQPRFAVVRRWPSSLPLYEVGHVERITELERCTAKLPALRLIGNAYRGVGLPDLIRDGRNAARELVSALGYTMPSQ